MVDLKENTVLIAKFMGEHTWLKEVEQGLSPHKELNYDKDWNQLMAVVEKIETINDNGLDVSILSDGTIIEDWRSGEVLVKYTSGDFHFDEKIEHTYQAVVLYISSHT
jgi:hypothetical protein